MNGDIALIVGAARKQAISAISLFGASVDAYHPFDPQRQYTPKELEPYDAMADRYIRAVEAAIRFFRAYERYQFGETSDTLRDLLNRMEKLTLVSSVQLWIEMRDQRNRIVHAYLPEKIKNIYEDVVGRMAKELLAVKDAGAKMSFDE